jgi:ElaB/YqjD/DUF883 family membrane-anchored ribosome-binding protein
MSTERGAIPGIGDEPQSRAMPPTQESSPTGAALGETVKVGFDRAGARVKDVADKTRDTLAGYCEGGVEQLSEDIVKYLRSQPMRALLIAAGVGLFVGLLMAQGRKPDAGNGPVLSGS